MSRKQKQKRKQEPSTRPKQAATSPSQPASKSRWLRSDIIIAMISLIIAITAILISLTIPEVRRFLGFDRPDQLRTLYTGNLSPSNGAPSNAQQSTAMISLFFDWESPEGDIAGTITTITTTQTQCSFRGTVTTDHHLRLTCRNPDLSFDGYIYADGHIKGTLSSSSGVTTWNLNRASADIPPAQPPSTPISSTPTQNVMTPTPVLLNLSQITIYNNPMSDVDSVAWSPDGKWLAFADLETVQVWDAHTGKLLLTYRGHSNGVYNLVTSIAWSPDGKWLASAYQDGTVQIWDAHTGKLLLTHQGYSYVSSVAWSPVSRQLAFNDYGTVQIWDAHTGKLLLTHRGYSYVSSVAWSPDGKWLASASFDDGTVQIWDAHTGWLLAMYESHKTDSVDCIAWSPDSRQLALGTARGTVQLLIPR